jgi:hypothetical protein
MRHFKISTISTKNTERLSGLLFLNFLCIILWKLTVEPA